MHSKGENSAKIQSTNMHTRTVENRQMIYKTETTRNKREKEWRDGNAIGKLKSKSK